MHKMKFVLSVICLFWLTSCAFAPAYDPVTNAKLAQIEVVATDLRSQCLILSPSIIHSRLEIPVMELQSMTKYRTNASNVNKGATYILKEIVSFENMYKTETKPSITYCADKLDDISMTVDTLLKPYGTLQ